MPQGLCLLSAFGRQVERQGEADQADELASIAIPDDGGCNSGSLIVISGEAGPGAHQG